MKLFYRIMIIFSSIMVIINFLFICDKYSGLIYCNLQLTFMALLEITKIKEKEE